MFLTDNIASVCVHVCVVKIRPQVRNKGNSHSFPFGKMLTGTIFISLTQSPYTHIYADNIAQVCNVRIQVRVGVRVVSRNVIKSQHLRQASHVLPA